jgi:hypothetical protein
MPAKHELCRDCKQYKYDTRFYLPINVERRFVHRVLDMGKSIRLCNACAVARRGTIKPAIAQKVERAAIYKVGN